MLTPPLTPCEITVRPSVIIDAPRAERPRVVVSPAVDDFYGVSPGFCIKGKCHCGDCGYWSGGRYTSADYERDIAAFNTRTPPPPLPRDVKERIVGALFEMIERFTAATNDEKIALIVPLANYILDEPEMEAFLAQNAGFAAVLKDRMLDFSRQLPGSKQSRLCDEVLRCFFYEAYAEECRAKWSSEDQW